MSFGRGRRALAALAASLHLAAGAANVLPPHLTGTWGMAQSLYEGETGQSHLHLEEDGLGILVGSTPPPRRLDADDGTPPRALIGFPVRATLDGATLTVRVIALEPEDAGKVARAAIDCTYDSAGPTLTCIGPKGPAMVMQRHGTTVPDDAARMLAQVRNARP